MRDTMEPRPRTDDELSRITQVQRELKLAVDAIPGLVFSAWPDGHMDMFNQRWLEYTGMHAREAEGFVWSSVICPEDLPSFESFWSRMLASGEPGEREARLRGCDGGHRWFTFRVVPLRDERGKLLKWYGLSTDVEGQKRAEALLGGEKRLLEHVARGRPLAEVLDELCQLLEAESGCVCSIVLVDETATRLLHGASPSLPPEYGEYVNGKVLDPRTGPCALAALEKAQVLVPDVATDARWETQGFRSLALEHGLLACWSTPIVSLAGQVLGAFAMYQRAPGVPTSLQRELIGRFTHLASIAIERKRGEDALARAHTELAHVARATMLGELAATIAHEVNQPLTAIAADANASLNWLSKQPPHLENARSSVANIVAECTRAADVLTRIRALLSRSSIGHRPLVLREVIHGVLPLARLELSRHAIQLKVSLELDGVRVLGDAVELQQVLLNLLLNAAEASRDLPGPQRRVVLSAWREPHDDGSWAHVAVADSGLGFGQADTARLFEPFYTTKPGGLGMGLSISRCIVERHGGRIWATANAQQGATFQLTLAAAEAGV